MAPEPKDYVHATDFLTARFSGSGSVEGVVVPTTDVVLPPTPEPSSTSGCEPEDFPPAPAEAAIALVQRGTCTYQQKVDNAAAAGYAAVLIFNEGQPGRQEVVQATLGTPVTIPAASTSFAVGEELAGLAGAGETRLRIAVEATTTAAQTANVIAETEDGSADSVVVIGAHLELGGRGPGDQRQRQRHRDDPRDRAPAPQARDHHAEPAALRLLRRRGVGPARLDPLRRGAHRPRSSTRSSSTSTSTCSARPTRSASSTTATAPSTGPVGPPGSGEIEAVFLDYMQAGNLPTRPTAFDGRSDYGPFIAKGIPAGGLFTGAEGLKTEEEAADFGGTAGEAYDKCYHQACDDLANVSEPALDALSDAAAHAVLHFGTELPVPVMTAFQAGAGRAASAVPLESLPFRGEGQFQN